MLELRKGQVNEKIVVTLTELITLAEPNFLFVFTQTTTKEKVSFVKLNSDDESDFPSRYNQFDINTNTLFGSVMHGQWNYEVYEQESETNLDPELATGIVEQGKMILYSATEFEFTQHNQATTFKVYNG